MTHADPFDPPLHVTFVKLEILIAGDRVRTTPDESKQLFTSCTNTIYVNGVNDEIQTEVSPVFQVYI